MKSKARQNAEAIAAAAAAQARIAVRQHHKVFVRTLTFTADQHALAKKHGTPAEFAVAVYQAVPEFLSMTEAGDAVTKYQREWDAAGT